MAISCVVLALAGLATASSRFRFVEGSIEKVDRCCAALSAHPPFSVVH
ncbi:MAG: hypothetical protein ACLGI7_15680 [Gammaproteobacteria bacterium]